MTAITAVVGIVMAVVAAATLAIVRDLATSGARGALLTHCERLLERAATALPPDAAPDILAEMLEDLRQRFDERGPLAAYWWARGSARRAIPTMANDLGREAPASEAAHSWAWSAVAIGACGASTQMLYTVIWPTVQLMTFPRGIGQQVAAVVVSFVIVCLAVLSGTGMSELIDWPGRLCDAVRQREARPHVGKAIGGLLLGIAVLMTLVQIRRVAIEVGWLRSENDGWVPGSGFEASPRSLDLTWLAASYIAIFLALIVTVTAYDLLRRRVALLVA